MKQSDFLKVLFETQEVSSYETVLITDSPNQVYEVNPFDIDCWIQFTKEFLKEISFPEDSYYNSTNEGIIKLIYSINGTDMMFFTKMENLNMIKRELNGNGIFPDKEVFNNTIYWNF